jgi:hypothetical protein
VGGKRRRAAAQSPAAQSPAAALRGGELAGLGRKRPFGHGLGSGLDWEQGRDTAKPSRAATRASVAGAKLAAAHGGQRRRRAPPGEIAREGGEKGSCGFTTLRRNSGGGSRSSGKRWNCGAAESSELGRSVNNGG